MTSNVRDHLFLALAFAANAGLPLLVTPAAPVGVALLLVATPAALAVHTMGAK
ncbi:MAG: hypothetical protein RLZZ515_41 [Cyanobacteriota bacterium]|jgi:hypothetical protein